LAYVVREQAVEAEALRDGEVKSIDGPAVHHPAPSDLRLGYVDDIGRTGNHLEGIGTQDAVDPPAQVRGRGWRQLAGRHTTLDLHEGLLSKQLVST